MAMPSGNVVLSDKIQQFPSGASGGGEMHQQLHRQWYPDERDGFISWIRGEFAAANAIIDSLCHHLRVVGEPGEYDLVISCIQQRRCNWNPVLHMQQYFSVSEVLYALQQVGWRRQQRNYDPVKVGGKEYKRSGMGYKQGQRAEASKESHNSYVVSHRYDGKSSDIGFGGSEKVDRMGEKFEELKIGGETGNLDDKAVVSKEEKKGNLCV